MLIVWLLSVICWHLHIGIRYTIYKIISLLNTSLLGLTGYVVNSLVLEISEPDLVQFIYSLLLFLLLYSFGHCLNLYILLSWWLSFPVFLSHLLIINFRQLILFQRVVSFLVLFLQANFIWYAFESFAEFYFFIRNLLPFFSFLLQWWMIVIMWKVLSHLLPFISFLHLIPNHYLFFLNEKLHFVFLQNSLKFSYLHLYPHWFSTSVL